MFEGADGGGIFLCTSGTTGTPKGILLREELLAHVASSVVDWHRLSRADRGYCSLPLFHVNAEVVGLLVDTLGGAIPQPRQVLLEPSLRARSSSLGFRAGAS